ncbi:MAG TPA: hypothetical protein VGM20_14010 [Gemmatimonadales bacterium]
MRIARPIAIGCAFVLAGSPLAAQGVPAGRVVLSVTTHLPDSLKSRVPIGDSITLRISAATDGKRFAFGITPGELAAMPMLNGISVRAIYDKGADSLHIGILVPPSMAAMAGGGPGMRIDLSTSTIDSALKTVSGKLDSAASHGIDSAAMRAMHPPMPAMRSLGTTSTVAGMQCANWETITANDTVITCVIPTPAAIQAFQEQFKAKMGLAKLMERYPQLAQMQEQAYGGKPMTPIRMSESRLGMHMELVSITLGEPDPAEFQLPADLKPMPLPGMPGKPSTMGALNQQ